MMRRRLEELSIEALLKVASKNGVEVDPDVDREELIDLVVEAIAENREDRQASSSAIVRIQQTKFSLLRDDETPLSADSIDEFELPTQYESTGITLMLRDPFWAFVYWDLAVNKREEYLASARFDGLFLRVLELEHESYEHELRIRDSFEVPVQLTDASWYVYLPRQNVAYRTQLIARNEHRRELLAVSNRIFAPSGSFATNLDDLEEPHRRLLFLCGLNRLEIPPFGAGGFPGLAHEGI